MTDQIAPSLATELEQIEGYFVSVGSYVRPVSNSKDWLLANGGSKGDKFYRADDVDALLTRASALARAAEKKADEWDAVAIEEVTERFPGWVGAESAYRLCAAQLRALVSSEGKGE